MGDASLGPRPEDDDALERARVKAEVRARLFGEAAPVLTVGPYELRRRIGSGAMGVVYEAWDPRLRRAVALKMLLSEGDDQRMTRLIREAQALAQLRHPNVVGVYDVGTHEGSIYVVMELVPGTTLDRWARHSRPDVISVLGVLAQIGQGLAAAHDRGLVHRDVKPENVLVDETGTPRVVDFGLARVADADLLTSLVRRIPGAALDVRLTQTGTALGTPVYMSPEQLKGAAVDARSDQYSFGVTAYYMLYGELPFASDSIGALVEAVTGNDVRVPQPRGEPEAARRAVLRALSVDPAARFPSMHELVAALSTRAPPATPGPARPPRAGVSPWIFAALALVGVVLVGAGLAAGWLLGQGDEAPQAVIPTLPSATPAVVPVPGGDQAMVPSSATAGVDSGLVDAAVEVVDAGQPASADEAPAHSTPATTANRPAPSQRRAPRRGIGVNTSNNLWRNQEPAAAAVRPLRNRVSQCFDPDWHYEGGSTQLGVDVTIDAGGRVEQIEVEDEPRYVPQSTRSCIHRVFTNGLRSFPPTTVGWGGTVSYGIPYRPID